MAPPPSSRPLPRAELSHSRAAGGDLRGRERCLCKAWGAWVRPQRPRLPASGRGATVAAPSPRTRTPDRSPARAAPGPAGWRGGGARGAGKVAELLCTLRSCSCDGSFPPPSWTPRSAAHTHPAPPATCPGPRRTPQHPRPERARSPGFQRSRAGRGAGGVHPTPSSPGAGRRDGGG